MRISLNEKEIQEVNQLLAELCSLPRWSACIAAGARYNELSKQSLNCIIAYILAIEAKNYGLKVKMSRLPKIALYRAFQKAIQCDICEKDIAGICMVGNINREQFDNITVDSIIKRISTDFFDFIRPNKNGIEFKIFKAATKIATLIELLELKGQISKEEFDKKKKEITKTFLQFKKIPGFTRMAKEDSKEFKIFQCISSLRNRVRWVKRFVCVDCSVLGHLYDTGVIAYFMGLYKSEEYATKMFWVGLFHDIPEAWTGDMPSPVKDSIPGLREATEKYECLMLKKNLYRKVPIYLAKEISKLFVSSKNNPVEYNFLKTADYLSADMECWRQIMAGSKDPYFKNVLEEAYKQKEKLPNEFILLINFFLK